MTQNELELKMGMLLAHITVHTDKVKASLAGVEGQEGFITASETADIFSTMDADPDNRAFKANSGDDFKIHFNLAAFEPLSNKNHKVRIFEKTKLNVRQPGGENMLTSSLPDGDICNAISWSHQIKRERDGLSLNDSDGSDSVRLLVHFLPMNPTNKLLDDLIGYFEGRLL